MQVYLAPFFLHPALCALHLRLALFLEQDKYRLYLCIILTLITVYLGCKNLSLPLIIIKNIKIIKLYCIFLGLLLNITLPKKN